MTPARHERISRLFLAARRLAGAERAAFLQAECGSDEPLRQEVAALLARDADSAPGLDAPVLGRELGGGALRRLLVCDDDVPPAAIGPYRILGELGSGGMGVVYRAEQRSPAREVALKVLRPGIAGRAMLRRFEHETSILARLQHPGIAQIFEAGATRTGGLETPYFAMELVEGPSLRRYAEQHGLDHRERIALIVRVCQAVEYAHRRGVIHRDLKPGNILVTRDPAGGQPQPKVLDFGVARLTDTDLHTLTVQTEAGQLIGTLAYMSPEQLAGDPAALDTRSDVYALGVLLYELLTGELPHAPQSGPGGVATLVRRIAEGGIRPPSACDRALRGDVDVIVQTALRTSPSERYQSAAALADDLERYLRAEPISAHAPSACYQLRSFVRRHRGLSCGVALALLALVAGLISTAAALRQARHDRDEAQRQTAIAESINGLLTRTLTAPDPWRRTRGAEPARPPGETTVLEALEQIEHELDGAFEGQPLVRAATAATLADMYRNLGDLGRAVRHNDAALALRKSLLGDEHPDTLASYRLRAVLLALRSRFAEAERTYAELLTVHRRVLPEDAPAVQECLRGLAEARQFQQKHAAAEDAARTLLEIRRRLYGDGHAETAEAYQLLASILSGSGQPAAALPMQRAVRAARLGALGADHPNSIIATYHVANTLRKLGRLAEARPLAEAALDSALAALGPDHAQTVVCRIVLARIERERADYAAAEALYLAALAGYERLLDPSHSAIVTTREELAGTRAAAAQHAREAGGG